MGSLYAKDVVDTALQEIGYQGDGKWNKYAEELDSIDYFNTKKNGAADWCAVFVCWCAYRNTLWEPSKWDAYYFLYQPSSPGANCAAGCTQAAGYYKDAGAWYSNTKDFERGDQIFFKKSNGAIYHTGIIVDWDGDGIYTVEGNTGSSQVLKRFYAYSDSRIAGVGRPRYDGWELPTAETPNTEPKPEPAPEPEPQGKEYTVRVNTFLNVRLGPSTSYKSIWKFYNGDKLTVYEEYNGWGKIGEDQWVCMDYLE